MSNCLNTKAIRPNCLSLAFNETDDFFASGRFFYAKGLLCLGGSETRPPFGGLGHPRRPNVDSHLDALVTKAALAKIDISLKNYQFHCSILIELF